MRGPRQDVFAACLRLGRVKHVLADRLPFTVGASWPDAVTASLKLGNC